MTLESLSATPHPVIIFGDNITSFGVIRGLRELGVEIYVVSDTGAGLAKYSKYVKEVFTLHHSENDYVTRIIDWIHKTFLVNPVLMVAGNDDALMVLSKEHRRLSECSIPTFPPWDIVNTVINKEIVSQIASDLDVPVIKTQSITSKDELDEYFYSEPNINYPLFLKSSYSRQFMEKYKTKGVICYSEHEVKEAFVNYSGFLGALLIQDFLPGDIDQISAVLLVLNKNSKVISVVANDKIRSAVRYGSTTLSSSSWNQKMVDDAIKLAEKAGYVGFVGVQFKYDPRCDEYKFLEINGRFSVSVSLACRCGVNMPKIVYEEFSGRGLAKLPDLKKHYQDNILLWFPFSDVKILSQKRFYTKPLHYISSLKGSGYVIEPFAINDPFPGLVEVTKFLTRPIRFLINKIRTHMSK